ncbi:hypothetical protein A2U01_0061726, partial [Trifolium medium]|nr:hypothetical protein [Trifolium medium]
DDVDVSGNSGERGSHHTVPTLTNVEPLRESGSEPNNDMVVATAMGHIPPARWKESGEGLKD